MIIGIYPENICMIIATMVVDSTLVCLAAASTWSCISNQEHLGTWWARKHKTLYSEIHNHEFNSNF